MEEKKRIKHNGMGHGTVTNESGDMYEIEWDEKPDFTQNGGRKVSSVPKDHVRDCCGGECGNDGCSKDEDEDEDDCDCGDDGMCSNCYDDDDWDMSKWDDEDWDDIGDLNEEELKELEEMLDNWVGGIGMCLRNKLLNKDVFSASFIKELRKGIIIEEK